MADGNGTVKILAGTAVGEGLRGEENGLIPRLHRLGEAVDQAEAAAGRLGGDEQSLVAPGHREGPGGGHIARQAV